jgi:uncharacterized protein DUF3991/Toprim domain-containing protein
MADDAELQLFRSRVNCAAVLEGMVGGWKLDVRESTRRALKYRRGKGEVLIITHDGRGWWDPLSQAKGDIFDLVQYLDRSLNFGQVRQVLRRFVGVAPTCPTAIRTKQSRGPNQPLQERWAKRPRLRPDSPAWTYLLSARRLPAEILTAAAAQDVIREGYYGSAWFAHRADGAVSHIEVRGPDYKGSLAGGHKTLFQFGHASEDVPRLAITEGPIDALSLAALEDSRRDTLYVATGGGMGPGTLGALQSMLARLATVPDTLIASAADANAAGDRHAERHAELAADAGVRFERVRPPEYLDFNDVLKQGQGT